MTCIHDPHREYWECPECYRCIERNFWEKREAKFIWQHLTDAERKIWHQALEKERFERRLRLIHQKNREKRKERLLYRLIDRKLAAYPNAYEQHKARLFRYLELLEKRKIACLARQLMTNQK